MWRIKRKQSRIQFFKCAAAIWTTHLRAHDGEAVFRIEKVRRAASDLERALGKVARFRDPFGIDHADDNRDAVFFETLESSELCNRNQRPVDIQGVKGLPLGPARNVSVKSFPRFDYRREHLECAFFRRRLDLFRDRGQTLLFHREIAVRAKLRSSFGKEQPQKMINLGHGRDGRFAAATRDALLNRHARRQPGDKIDIGLLQLFDKLPRIRRHAVEKSSLSFGEQDIEREGRFTGATQTCDDHHPVARNLDVDIFQVVLARAVNTNRAIAAVNAETRGRLSCASEFFLINVRVRQSPCRTTQRSARTRQNFLQKPAGVRVVDLRDLFGRANAHDVTAFVTCFGSKIDNPIGGLNHFEIVLDHDDRVSALDQPLKNLQQCRDVIEMQSSGRFVENEKITVLVIFAILSGFRTACPARTPVSGLGQMPH